VFTVPHPAGSLRNARIVRCQHHQPRVVTLQFGHPANVIVVVVGQQHGVGTPLLLRCRSQYRRGLAGVDHDGVAVLGDQRPDVIVRECG